MLATRTPGGTSLVNRESEQVTPGQIERAEATTLEALALLDSETLVSVERLAHQVAMADGMLSAEEWRAVSTLAGAASPQELATRPLTDLERTLAIERLQADPEALRVFFELLGNIAEADQMVTREELALLRTLYAEAIAKVHPVETEGLEPLLLEMISVTPKICHEKADCWQKPDARGRIKPVAAAMSFIDGKGEKQYRTAVNLELSTPSGSRCAEQNALGAIVGSHPGVRFEAFREVVVYGGGDHPNPLLPCGVCLEQLGKIAKVNPTFAVYGYPSGYDWTAGPPATLYRVPVRNLIPRNV